jgi:outer membrane protein TolC
MRWNAWLGPLALVLAAVVGCKQQTFLTLEDYKFYQGQMIQNLATDQNIVTKPTIDPTQAPMTINDTNREVRYISLAECMAIALEQGTTGNTNVDTVASGFSGSGIPAVPTSRDQPAAFAGAQTNARFSGSDAIRVLRLDPAVAGANLESSLTKFDAVWQSSASWQSTDRPVGTAIDAFQAQNQTNAISQMQSTVQSSVLKPLPTGGVAGITFLTNYTLTNLAARVNPSYQPTLQFQFEQPLLQGFGVEINQLRASHPGSVLSSGLNGLAPTAEGILITRVRLDQQRADFEQKVQAMVANVEIAYWNLYYAYWNLYANEALLRSTFETLRITQVRLIAGSVAVGDLDLARGQYEDARSSRLRALNGVLDFERQLRGMLQLRGEDGTRLVPSDQPTLAPYYPDWLSGYQEAMTMRPELFIARQEIKAAQMNLAELKNELLPDLRFTSTYDMNSIGTRLDGPDGANALRNLASNHFNNWALGLRYTVPIGYRAAYANLRRGQLTLAHAYETLVDTEMKIERNLVLNYQRIAVSYELIRTNQAARIAYGDQVRVRLQLYKAGKKDATLNFVLQAQQQWANSLSQEYQSIRDYNESLVGWEFAKGTTLVRNNIQVSEGALPAFAQVRAVEHEREKAAALKLREHPMPMAQVTDPAIVAAGPAVPAPGLALPDVMKTMPLLKDAPPAGALSMPMPTTPGQQTQPASIPVEDLRSLPSRLPDPGAMPTTQPGAPVPAQPIATTPNGLPNIEGTPLPAIGSVPVQRANRKPRDPNAPSEFSIDRKPADGGQP